MDESVIEPITNLYTWGNISNLDKDADIELQRYCHEFMAWFWIGRLDLLTPFTIFFNHNQLPRQG
jgi:hypothetical protein